MKAAACYKMPNSVMTLDLNAILIDEVFKHLTCKMLPILQKKL